MWSLLQNEPSLGWRVLEVGALIAAVITIAVGLMAAVPFIWRSLREEDLNDERRANDPTSPAAVQAERRARLDAAVCERRNVPALYDLYPSFPGVDLPGRGPGAVRKVDVVIDKRDSALFADAATVDRQARLNELQGRRRES